MLRQEKKKEEICITQQDAFLENEETKPRL
jgi:hypothetical protein